MAGCAASSAAEERCPTPPLLTAFTTHRACITCRCPHSSPTIRRPRATVARQPRQVVPSWLSPMDGRIHPALPDAAPPLSLPLPSLLGSVSPPLPLFWSGTSGSSLPPVREIHPQLVPLPVLFALDSLPDPRDRPRLLLVAGAPPSTPVDINTAAPSVAEAALGCVRGTPEHASDMISLPPAIWGFSVTRSAVSPSSICPLTHESLSDAGASPPGGTAPAAGNGTARLMYVARLKPRGPTSSGVPPTQNRGPPGTTGRAVQCKACG